MSVQNSEFTGPGLTTPKPAASSHSTADDEVLKEICAAALHQLHQSGFAQARLTLVEGCEGRFRLACGDLDYTPSLEKEKDFQQVVDANQRTIVEIRLKHGEQWIGSLALSKGEHTQFTPADIHYLTGMAGQISANLDMACRLMTEQAYHRQTVSDQSAMEGKIAFQRLLLSIFQANFESDSPAHTLQTIAEQVAALFGPAACYISLWDNDAQEVRLVAAARLDKTRRRPTILLPEIQTLTIICLDGRRCLSVEDIHTQRGVSNLAPHMKDVSSLLALPLQITSPTGDRSSLGAILLAYADPRQFMADFLTPLEQAAAALASVLFKQRALSEAQRKAQENNILQQAGELIHSSLEQEEVIANILQQWTSMMPGKSHSILLRRDGNLAVVAVEGDTRLTKMQGDSFPIIGVNPISVVLHSGKPLKIKHGRGEYTNLPDEVFSPNCVWLGVPLPYRGRVIGLLMTENYKINDYTPAQVRQAHMFAKQVAAALEHARLYAREQHRVRELNALQQATAALLSTLNLEELLGQILDAAIMALPGSTHGSIYLVAPQTGKLQIRAMYGDGPARGYQVTLLTSEPYVIQAVKERVPLLIPHIEDSQPVGAANTMSRPQSAIVAPLLLREKVLGALFVGAGQSNVFTQENLHLLESFATTATEALQNAMLHAEVKSYAITDSLTSLNNRRGLFELGEAEVERAQRFKRPLSLIMFDIDNFKTINDQDGHDVGDEILREIAQRCRQFARGMDIVARFGGDEFVVILLEANLQAAQEIGRRLLKGIGDTPVQTSNGPKRVTVSMGISLASSGAADLTKIIKAADTALYVSKGQGGNCISIR